MNSIYFVERRLNKSRISHLEALATKSKLFIVVHKPADGAILVAQDSTQNEVVEYLIKHKKIQEFNREDYLFVDVSWFVRCMKEKKVLEIKPSDKLVFQETTINLFEDTTTAHSLSPPPKKSCFENVNTTKYACQQSTPLHHCNKKLTDALEVLEQHALFRGDANSQARALAFRRGSASLKAFPREVRSVNDIKNLFYLGVNNTKVGHCESVVTEILTEGFSHEVESVISSDFYQIMKRFCGIFGVGPTTARKWFYELNLRTLDDIKRNNHNLTQDQCLGIEHYNDLNTPVTITEAKYIEELVRNTCKKLCSKLTVTLVGGFRRGKLSGHDVDLLISHSESGKEVGVLPLIIKQLKTHFIYSEKKMSSSQNANSNDVSNLSTMDHFDKCFGILKFCNEWIKEDKGHSDKAWKAVRVDLIVVPHEQFAFALLGWTGTKHFEREIRRYARAEKQIILTSHGMYSLCSNQNFSAFSEKEIFNKLELVYRPPSERCC